MREKGFPVGAEVRVKTLKQDGRILEKTSKGTYRVALGNLTLEAKEKDLMLVPELKTQRKTKSSAKKFSVSGEITQEKMPEVLDLHGLRVEEALPLVAHFVDQAILQDKDSALILHGLGTGKLLQAVHQFLKKTPTVKRFELDPTNPGFTKVFF